jgi:(p)ppGpp synthase/HD superfamily hydrolase
MRYNVVDRAMVIAFEAHKDQRYGNNPYSRHLADVVKVLERYGVKYEPLLAAGWLHDVLEDTDLSRLELAEKFDIASYPKEDRPLIERTLQLVSAVTGEGKNRRERNASIYEKVTAEGLLAAILKCADRMANVESCYDNRDTRLFMYWKEHGAFREAMVKASRNRTDDGSVGMLLSMIRDLDRRLDWSKPGSRDA